jgi:pilus assembly protein CpaF
LSLKVEKLVDTILQTEHIPDQIELGKEELKRDILEIILGFGPIEEFLKDPEVDEIMINTYKSIWIEKYGKLFETDRRFLDDTHLSLVIERMLRPIGKTVNDLVPYADGRLEDGSRINVVIPPLAIDGPLVTIRKFPEIPLTMSDLITKYNSLTEDLADFLKIIVRNRKNVIISGGSGSGKTTMLNCLSAYIPKDERIVTIEDSAEIQLKQPHVGRLETRLPNFEGKGQVSIRDLVKNALRMRPDRIVIGECRGGEAVDMLQAMNTGHDGSLTTVHANGPSDALVRIETMVSMAGLDIPSHSIKTQVASAIDIVIHISRLGDGSRKIVKVSEVLELDKNEIVLQDLFNYEKDYVSSEGEILGSLKPTGNIPSFINNVITEERKVMERIFIENRMKGFEQ